MPDVTEFVNFPVINGRGPYKGSTLSFLDWTLITLAITPQPGRFEKSMCLTNIQFFGCFDLTIITLGIALGVTLGVI